MQLGSVGRSQGDVADRLGADALEQSDGGNGLLCLASIRAKQAKQSRAERYTRRCEGHDNELNRWSPNPVHALLYGEPGERKEK
ncbi:hypothetical protein [Pandoraea sp.]|uniref:hypothetical protein n=1 Tax=Pandoraea sp. TaxID=1883445 RepID=UPI0012081483|nr:hypothetical protein [Pandoraea sp.]TAL52883.1 MAG: hypothetical protein EPN80_17725 [Pandoraea sp.]TAM19672.1 MAG: hypothetical protein EPN65_02760 [Pandoraea sp.]